MAKASNKTAFQVGLSRINRTEARIPNSRNSSPFILIQVGLVKSFMTKSSSSFVLACRAEASA
jgi:hypothetical protein